MFTYFHYIYTRIDLGTDRHRHVFLDGHENSPIISNMLCVKKTTLKIGIRIVLDTRYVNYDSAGPTRIDR